MKPRVLVVEDEEAISEPLGEHLAREGFDPAIAGTIEEARGLLQQTPPDLILLDVMLPDGDGRDLCREIRRTSDVPIIMLTARGEEVDKIVGPRAGSRRLRREAVQRRRARRSHARDHAARPRHRAQGPRHRRSTHPRSRPPAPSRSGTSPSSSPRRSSTSCISSWRTPARSARASRSWTRSGTRTGSAPRRRSTST